MIIIQEFFDKFWLRSVEEAVFFFVRLFVCLKSHFESAPNDPKMTLNAKRPKVPYIR